MTTTTTTTSSSSSSSTPTLASLLKLLPTGTVFLFQFLNPVLSNNGNCHPSNKILTSILIAVCGLSCVVSSFTDSYTDKDGNARYGFVTRKGLIPFTAPIPSSSSSYPDNNDNNKKELVKDEEDENGLTDAKYKLTIADFVHAVLAVVVFCTVVILDSNTAECFFPSIESEEDTLMSVLPVAVGTVTAAVMKFFPYSRHGVGYTSLSSSSNSSSSGSSSSDSSSPV